MSRRDNANRIPYEDRSGTNGVPPGSVSTPDATEDAARKWWPFAKWVGGIVFAVAAATWAAAYAFADKPSKDDVDQRIDERIESRAATTATVKEMIHDLSPYNADRATVQALPAKLDAILNALSAVREDVGVVKEAVKQIKERTERIEQRNRP